MSTLYHIHVSCIRSDPFEESFWQQGYWSLVATDNIREVVEVENKMNRQLRNDTRTTIRAKEFQTIIAIVKKNNKDDNFVVLQQLYQGWPNISLNDLYFNQPDSKVPKYEIYCDSCHRDDTKENSDSEAVYESDYEADS